MRAASEAPRQVVRGVRGPLSAPTSNSSHPRQVKERELNLGALLSAAEDVDAGVGQASQGLAENHAVAKREAIVWLAALILDGRNHTYVAQGIPGGHENCGAVHGIAAQMENVRAAYGFRHELRNASRETHLTFVEEGHPIREAADLVDTLSRPDHGGPALRLCCDQRLYVPGTRWIKIVRCLIDQEDRRIRQEGSCDRQAFLHPVGIGSDGCASEALQADIPEALEGSFHGLPLRESEQSAEEHEVLQARDAEIERSIARWDEAEQLAGAPGLQGPPGDPRQADLTVIG